MFIDVHTDMSVISVKKYLSNLYLKILDALSKSGHKYYCRTLAVLIYCGNLTDSYEIVEMWPHLKPQRTDIFVHRHSVFPQFHKMKIVIVIALLIII
jgi:hypothetical protein